MHRLKSFLERTPLFLFLLPVFFVLHEFVGNFHYSLAKESSLLTLRYIGVSVLFALFFRLFIKNFYKACLPALFIMAFNFFFGSLYDFIKNNLGDIILIKFSIIIACMTILLLLLTVYLRKTNRRFEKLGLFLNCLLLILILFDAVSLTSKLSQEPPTQVADLTKAFNTCDTCSTPDIYLIIADEYAGKTELQDVFSFDNSRFENELKNRGFFIIDSSYSNYNATVYSMSSMFSMDYLHGLQEKVVNHRDMFSCRSLIKQNNLISFLKDRNYEFYNYSPFDFAGKNNFVITPFFATKKELFTSQTFTNRFWRSMGYHFVSDEEVKKSKRIHLFNNIRIDSMTKKTAAERINSPKFVYTHIALPHHPYYYDSAGKENPYDYSNHKYPSGYPDYIQYLIYSNKKLLEIVDHIRSSSQRPAIIILMSDHGFRQLPNTVDAKYHFMTLNAVYFPNENYSGFYKGMSNVNQFRIILNSQFGQKLPILKDSSFFLVDP